MKKAKSAPEVTAPEMLAPGIITPEMLAPEMLAQRARDTALLRQAAALAAEKTAEKRTVAERLAIDKCFALDFSARVADAKSAKQDAERGVGNAYAMCVLHIVTRQGTWEGGKEYFSESAKSTLRAIQTVINAGLAQGVNFFLDDGAVKTKNVLYNEARAKAHGLPLNNPDGTPKTSKQLGKDVAEAVALAGGKEPKTPETLEKATPEQLVQAGLLYMHTEPDVFVYPHVSRCNQILRLADAIRARDASESVKGKRLDMRKIPVIDIDMDMDEGIDAESDALTQEIKQELERHAS